MTLNLDDLKKKCPEKHMNTKNSAPPIDGNLSYEITNESSFLSSMKPLSAGTGLLNAFCQQDKIFYIFFFFLYYF
jgi:hypothetical protein